ncbi:MAG: ATP-binding cassette domain-containing protein [Nitrososphaeria archaeon]|nr:ATP-binding cassette domain-containing protein [Nitrososphaeria archaeon]MDW7986238.1 ATP-binding cassette domain-containing protein [Nitrososphaerota archaeon]
MNDDIFLKVIDVKKYFPVGKSFFTKSRRFVKAVDGVSFKIERGGTLGIVGESGSGKTTLARVILRLIEPTSGSVYLDNQNIFSLTENELRQLRPQMQIIFQDPMASLNPRKKVEQTLSQVFKLHTTLSDQEIYDKILSLLERVGLTPPELFLERYPHELSGGQRQRLCIARAIALNPKLLIADEPVSALDVSVRGQIINLLLSIFGERKEEMVYIIISHDIALIRSMCRDTLVMYLGRMVELGDTDGIIEYPLHPYTKMLISAIPIPDPEIARMRKHIPITGEPPSLINPPPGCHFHPRCPYVMDKCRTDTPPFFQVDGRLVSCFLYKEEQK